MDRVRDALRTRLPACFRLPADALGRALAGTRLSLIEIGLQRDPNDDRLRVEAFEAALLAGDAARAKGHLEAALRRTARCIEWQIREGEYWLACRDPKQAGALWLALLPLPAEEAWRAPVLAHHLAVIDGRLGRVDGCVDRLAAFMDPPEQLPVSDDQDLWDLATSMVRLWLQALNRKGAFVRASTWCHAAAQAGRLEGLLLGPASLMAWQAGDVSSADRWSRACLRHSRPGDETVEAVRVRAWLDGVAAARRSARRGSDVAH